LPHLVCHSSIDSGVVLFHSVLMLQVMFCMDKSIELSPECKKFRILKAECLALLRRYQESQEIVK